MKPKSQKRKEAQDRAKKYSSMSLEDKIALVESRPGESKRELARLKAKLAQKSKKPQE